jgi:predicted esterase
MVRRHLATLVAGVLVLGVASDTLTQRLGAVATCYYAKLPAVATIAGRDTAFDYYQRLHDDAAQLAQNDSDTVERAATLDLSLVEQLLDRKFVPMNAIRGLGEMFVRSSRDGTMQPVAVYVPPSYSPQRPASLLVLLHGRPQPETWLMAPPFIAQLADANGTIVVAPWGGGFYDFRGSELDVYDALHAALSTFNIDPRKKYLGGYSMGGFSVFEVAPLHPNEWSAVMSIAGSLLGSDASRAVAMLRNTPIYVLTGTDDQSIPTRWPTATAAYLSLAGLNVSFYSQKGGTHRLVSLLPILEQAWSDMLHQIVRAPSGNLATLPLPGSIPANPMKP